MSTLAVRVEGLGKQYRLGGPVRTTTLRESLVGAFTAPMRMLLAVGLTTAAAAYWVAKPSCKRSMPMTVCSMSFAIGPTVSRCSGSMLRHTEYSGVKPISVPSLSSASATKYFPPPI